MDGRGELVAAHEARRVVMVTSEFFIALQSHPQTTKKVGSFGRDGQTVQTKKRELVPVASLDLDLAVADAEEPAAPQP